MKNEKVSFIQNLVSLLGFWFSVLDVDDHYVIKIFGIKICKRHKVNLTYKEIKTSGTFGIQRVTIFPFFTPKFRKEIAAGSI